MAFITADRVKDTSTTTGTGNITVSGSAPFGYRTFSTVLSVGDTFYYCIQGQGTAEWEVGLGTYASTNQFARTTVLASSASGSAVSFSSGTKNVFITLPANKTLQFDASGSPTAGGILYGTGSMLSYSAVGTAGQVLVSGGSGAPTWSTVVGLGTVTSVNVSGGTTGLTASGGPVTTSGTITLAGTLAAANGGTGLTSPGTSGNVLTSDGSAWVSQAPSGGSGTSISNGTSNVTIASSNGAITAATAGTTAMTIDTSQNVGIGNSAPSSFNSSANKLVVGTGSGNSGITIYSGSASQSSVYFGYGTTGAQAYAGQFIYNHANNSFSTYVNGTTLATTIDASGNVGIGTSSPTSILNTYAASGSLSIQYVATNNNGGSGVAAIGFNVAAASETTAACAKAGIGLVRSATFGGGSLCFYNNNSGAAGNFTTADEKMRIDSSGNLLVGQSSWSWSNNGTEILSTGRMWNVSNTDYNLELAGSQAARVRFYTSAGGNGTTVGSISVTTSATAYNTSSDYRLKHSVASMVSGLSTVSALKPVTYKWNVDDSDGEGFIAHELQEVIPHAVTGEKDAVDEDGKPIHQGVDYSKIVVHLVAAIQELSAKNDALEARLAALEVK